MNTSRWTGPSTSRLHNRATVDFNMSKSKSLETGGSLAVVRSCGSHVSCLCLTCGSVPAAAPGALSGCHGRLYSDTCSAAVRTCYWCGSIVFKPARTIRTRADTRGGGGGGCVCLVCRLASKRRKVLIWCWNNSTTAGRTDNTEPGVWVM